MSHANISDVDTEESDDDVTNWLDEEEESTGVQDENQNAGGVSLEGTGFAKRKQGDAGGAKGAVVDVIEPLKKKRNTKAVAPKLNFDAEQYAVALSRHKNDITRELGHAQDQAAQALDETLQCALISLLPPYLTSSGAGDRSASADGNMKTSTQYLQNLCVWFSSTFSCISSTHMTAEEGRDGSNTAALMSCLGHGVGSRYQLVQLAFALLRGLGFEARFVSTIDPSSSFLPMDHADLVYQQNLKRRNRTPCESGKRKRVGAKEVNISCWLEILLRTRREGGGRDEASGSGSVRDSEKNSRSFLAWVHCDPILGIVGTAAAVENSLRTGSSSVGGRGFAPLQYVLAFEFEQHNPHCHEDSSFAAISISNITEKYRFKHTASTKKAKEISGKINIWLAELVRETRVFCRCADKRKSGPTTQTSPAAIMDIDEPSESCASAVEGIFSNINPKVMPTRLADFKDHPTYALERFFAKNEVLNPKLFRRGIFPIAGYFKGEKVYRREHVQRVLSRMHWRRSMRDLPADAVPYDYRVPRGESSSSVAGAGTGSNHQEEYALGDGGEVAGARGIALFGEWQTVPLQIPPVVGRVLPVNEYGNIEIWDGKQCFVPAGAAFICCSVRSNKFSRSTLATAPADLKVLEQACLQLGVPFARAVTGFSYEKTVCVSTSKTPRNWGFSGDSRPSSGGGRPEVHFQAQPAYGGVVVLAEDRDMIVEAAAVLEAVQREHEREQWERQVARRWGRMVHAVLSRQALREKYGH